MQMVLSKMEEGRPSRKKWNREEMQEKAELVLCKRISERH